MSKRISRCIMGVGLALLVAALLLSLYNLWDERRAAEAAQHALLSLREELAHRVETTEDTTPPETTSPSSMDTDEPPISLPMIPPVEVIPDYILDPDMPMPTVALNGLDYIGVLDIPSLELSLPVIAQWSYPALKFGPCRYSGSVYRGDMVILAHDYKSHFKALRNISVDAEVIFTDSAGNVFRYSVVELEIVDENDEAAMLAGEWDMTLFTCTSGGNGRFTVRCEWIQE